MRAVFFINQLREHGIDAYYGVPDSLLKSICAYITDNTDAQHNVITANEGNAIGLACGHYLATGRPALVYMQNSGQGNCVNPLLSLMDQEVYSIPVLMLIGWRGEPGVKDEPQHVKQGKVTLELLETMGIKYSILSADEEEAANQINMACASMKKNAHPYALIAKKNTFEPYSLQNKRQINAEISREEAICTVTEMLDPDDIVIATTGQISRELYEFRKRKNEGHQRDFLTVGAMGHASSIAMGIALNRPERRIVCMDGDGAFLMHMGASAIIGNAGLKNLRHIVLNNAAHDSVGGQPTVADRLNIGAIAKACGYSAYYRASTLEELRKVVPTFLATQCTSLLEIIVKCGSRSNLGRPKETPTENKKAFMSFTEEGKSIVRPGAFSELSQLIKHNRWKSILLFCSERCRKKLHQKIEAQLDGCDITHYPFISPNPTAQEIAVAVNKIHKKIDAIIAIGGGSVIDFAKLYRASYDNKINILNYYTEYKEIIKKTPLIAIPTTAGTGSEATRFAVVYINGEKYSFDNTAVMPDFSLVDSNLMYDAPRYLKASTGMDALSQAIEGFWARGATKESDQYAKEAIKLCCNHLVEFVNSNSKEAAAAMAKGAYLAGKCINIARTTAAHALSYKITQLYGLPHGHAVALSIPALTELHLEMARVEGGDKIKLLLLEELLGTEKEGIRQWFYKLYEQIGIEYNCEKLGIDQIQKIVYSVNIERLSNNPFPLDKRDLLYLFVEKNNTESNYY